MGIKEQIEKDFLKVLKERKTELVLVLRLIKAAIRNAEIAKIGQLTEEELIKLLRSEIKKRKEAIIDFQRGRRQDLVQKEEREIEIIQKYLPPEIGEKKVRKLIKKAISETGAEKISDLGKVMAKVIPEIKGQMEGSKVSQLVREELEKMK